MESVSYRVDNYGLVGLNSQLVACLGRVVGRITVPPKMPPSSSLEPVNM